MGHGSWVSSVMGQMGHELQNVIHCPQYSNVVFSPANRHPWLHSRSYSTLWSAWIFFYPSLILCTGLQNFGV